MKKNIVSVPRSGQHMLERSLRFYHEQINLEFHYCEYYGCCKSRPCKINKSAYQKDHDLKVTSNKNISIPTNEKFLFLYRENLLQQLESSFRYELVNRKVLKDSNMKIGYHDEFTRDYFKKFVSNPKFINYYKVIYKKYLNKKRNNVFCIEYDNFVLNFSDIFEKILIFFEVPIDKKLILKTEEFIKPILIHRISKNDEYYDELNDFVNNLVKT